MHSEIPRPFIFSPLRHHAGYLNLLIAQIRDQSKSANEIGLLLVKMGNAMVDVYVGGMPVQAILDEIRQTLEESNIFQEESFRRFIDNYTGKFHNIVLSDDSEWTLLIGNERERYLHVHPARKSPYVVRVRAISLKTAFLLRIFFESEANEDVLVEQVNFVRDKYLHESPVKNASYTRRIQRILPYLNHSKVH